MDGFAWQRAGDCGGVCGEPCAENSLSGVVFKQGYENAFKLLIRSGSKDRAQDAQPSTVPPTSTRTGSSDTPAATTASRPSDR